MMAEELLTALFNAEIAVSIGATVLSLGVMFTVAESADQIERDDTALQDAVAADRVVAESGV